MHTGISQRHTQTHTNNVTYVQLVVKLFINLFKYFALSVLCSPFVGLGIYLQSLLLG